MITETIEIAIRGYANRLKFDRVSKILNGKPFILAGGSLGREKPNDFDIYGLHKPISIAEVELEIQANHSDKVQVVEKTLNALTIEYEGQAIQFCKYHKPTPDELIRSFDFAHCQVAVVFDHDMPVYTTEDWIEAKAMESTFYTGSEYPLSSLIRAGKFYRHGKFANKGAYEVAVLAILKDIAKRGFKDWTDFVDQVGAISTGLTDLGKARELYDILHTVAKTDQKEDKLDCPF